LVVVPVEEELPADELEEEPSDEPDEPELDEPEELSDVLDEEEPESEEVPFLAAAAPAVDFAASRESVL